jgi:hypothetical protein
MSRQFFDQRPSFLSGHTLKALRVDRIDEQDLSTGDRVARYGRLPRFSMTFSVDRFLSP